MATGEEVDYTTACELTRYLDVSCPCAHADMAFVYGTRLPDPMLLRVSAFTVFVSHNVNVRLIFDLMLSLA